MDDLINSLPITLVNLLNNFNEELTNYRKNVTLESNIKDVKLNGIEYQNVRLIYKFKKTQFYFQISYVLKGDFISWNYYPVQEISTKTRSRQRSEATDSAYKQLFSEFKKWKTIVKDKFDLENPLEYFETDNFIEFYSGEIIEQIPTTEKEEKYPLPFDKQSLALRLIEKQESFLESEIDEESKTDINSEKYFDLLTAKNSLGILKKELPRMTAADVKKQWSISFGIILKWCANKFLQFLKLDNNTGNDLSRSIGSFIGGVFGIQKLE